MLINNTILFLLKKESIASIVATPAAPNSLDIIFSLFIFTIANFAQMNI